MKNGLWITIGALAVIWYYMRKTQGEPNDLAAHIQAQDALSDQGKAATNSAINAGPPIMSQGALPLTDYRTDEFAVGINPFTDTFNTNRLPGIFDLN